MVDPALGRLGQEDCKSEASLDCTASLSLLQKFGERSKGRDSGRNEFALQCFLPPVKSLGDFCELPSAEGSEAHSRMPGLPNSLYGTSQSNTNLPDTDQPDQISRRKDTETRLEFRGPLACKSL